VHGHKIYPWDNHINIPGHEILAQLLSQKISDFMLRVCLNKHNPKCHDDQSLYTSYASLLHRLEISSSKDVVAKKFPLVANYDILGKLLSSNHIFSTVLKSWTPAYGNTNDIIICAAKMKKETNQWECSESNELKERMLYGTKVAAGRIDKFVGVDSPLCGSNERLMVQFKLTTISTFGLFTPMGVHSYNSAVRFQWYEHIRDNIINIDKDNDVTQEIKLIDTSNSVLAFKEYHNFFHYLFVNKKYVASSNKKYGTKNLIGREETKALNLLICSDLKEIPKLKKDRSTFSGAWAL
jgi:hypothetical protein